MIRHILFPVDFSEPCTAISAAVRAWATHFQARVTLLHVLDTTALFAVDNPDFSIDLSRLKSMATSRLDTFLADELSGLAVDRVLAEGSPSTAIVHYASANNVDLIMLPTLGYTRFRQMLLGSVTAAVLHDSEIPIWTNAHQPNHVANAIPKTIACAVDCGAETSSVVRFGIELAHQFKANLSVVHSRPKIDQRFQSGVADRAHQFLVSTSGEDYSAATAGLANAPELEIVEDESIASGVQSVIEREKAELLVIGRGKIHGFMGRLRSNAHDLIRTSGCPVLSV